MFASLTFFGPGPSVGVHVRKMRMLPQPGL